MLLLLFLDPDRENHRLLVARAAKVPVRLPDPGEPMQRQVIVTAKQVPAADRQLPQLRAGEADPELLPVGGEGEAQIVAVAVELNVLKLAVRPAPGFEPVF